MEEKTNLSHSIILEERKKLSVGGVEDVVAFDDENIILETVKGRLIIKGDNMHITQFDTKTGDLWATGDFSAFGYTTEQKANGFFARVFK